MFEDEARFGRINDPKRCWAPHGMRPSIACHFVREYVYAYGAVCPKDGSADFLILPGMQTHCMSLFLKELGRRYEEEIILLILDGASNHKAAKALPKNILLAYLPPYCPELNPVEHIWEDMREKHFKNKAFSSLSAVESNLAQACIAYESNPTSVKSICGFHWILNTV
jgi:transposase